MNAANSALRSKFRTAVKSVLKAVATGDKAKASDACKSAQRVIDSIADKGIFHKNKAARLKSRLFCQDQGPRLISDFGRLKIARLHCGMSLFYLAP